MTPTQFRAQRDRLNLSQAELGVILGIQRFTVSRYERGVLEVPPPTALAMRLLTYRIIKDHLLEPLP